MRGVTFILCLQLATSACAHVDDSRTSGADENSGESGAATSRGSDTAAPSNRDIPDRFPGAAILNEAEFASAIVGRRFRYRLSNDIIMERPAEHFYENGRYSVGHRAIAQGTYSFEGGIVSIECGDCRYRFFGLGQRRVFFRHQGRLFMADADGNGSVVELIPAP